MKALHTICGIAMLLAAAAAPLDAQPPDDGNAPGWPQWLGPARDGISRQTGWSEAWPEAGLEIRWEREIGIGFSSISGRGELIYTMGHVDGREYVWCLNRKSGETVWSHSYPCELVDNLYEGGPGATPTIDGDLVYALGKEGQLFCFQRRSGAIVWQCELQQQLDVELHEWGFNGSPLVLGNQLLLEAGRVVSFDKRTGKKLWQTPRHQAGYGSVTPLAAQGQTLLATLDCDGLRIVKASDGSRVAFTEWPSPFRTNSTTPIVSGQLIYISSGYNVGCGLFALQDGQLEKRYESRAMRNHFNNSILFDGHLYGFDGNSNLGRVVKLTCMDFRTGEVKWQHRGLGCGSLIIADGKLLILSERGELVLAKASPAGFVELARSPLLEGRCWTTPALLGGTLLARNASGRLVCVELPRKR